MFNLSKYQNKYPGLLSEDVDILQKYLSDEKFTDFFEELVQYNKKNKTVKYGILLFIILLAVVFFFLWSHEKHIDIITWWKNDGWIYLLIMWLSWAILYVVYLLFQKAPIAPKAFRQGIATQVHKNFVFSDKNEKQLDLNNPVLENIINSFDREDKYEDIIECAISWEANWNKKESEIKILGWEIKTSKKHRVKTKNGYKTVYRTSNSWYLLKIDFPNKHFPITSKVSLCDDEKDRWGRSLLKVFITTIFITIFPLFFGTEESSNDFSGTIYMQLLELSNMWNIPAVIFFWALFIAVFAGVHLFYSYIETKTNMKMENIEFEKIYDVQSKDWIDARTLLTPSFMYKIVDYIHKSWRGRVVEFVFTEQELYVYINFLKTNSIWNYFSNRTIINTKDYMEVSMNSKKNIVEDSVQFYLEIKGIMTLVQELDILQFDKN